MINMSKENSQRDSQGKIIQGPIARLMMFDCSAVRATEDFQAMVEMIQCDLHFKMSVMWYFILHVWRMGCRKIWENQLGSYGSIPGRRQYWFETRGSKRHEEKSEDQIDLEIGLILEDEIEVQILQEMQLLVMAKSRSSLCPWKWN